MKYASDNFMMRLEKEAASKITFNSQRRNKRNLCLNRKEGTAEEILKKGQSSRL